MMIGIGTPTSQRTMPRIIRTPVFETGIETPLINFCSLLHNFLSDGTYFSGRRLDDDGAVPIISQEAFDELYNLFGGAGCRCHGHTFVLGLALKYRRLA
jgi:hypothetical protein